MNPNLFIRYKGIDHEHDSDIDLAELGESLAGFDSLFREFAHVMRFQGDLDIKATTHRDGSHIVDLVVRYVNDAKAWLPFGSIEDFLNFLKLASDSLWQQATDYFNSIAGERRTLNDWAIQNPLDAAVLVTLLAEAIKKLFKKARQNKEHPDLDDRELPRRIAEELHKLINKKGFKKTLKPIVEDKVESIEVSTDRSFQSAAKIDQTNFQEYLADDEQILPHLENGQTHKLVGVVSSLKGTRGDSLTFHVGHGGEFFNLDVLPSAGTTSKTYRQFYQETVQLKAVVMRDSFYKKPKLQMLQIDLHQPELPLGIAKDSSETKL